MRIQISSEVIIQEPTPAAYAFCANQLTVANPEYTRKSRMGKWIGDTPKYLNLYRQRGKDLILPFGAYRALYQFLRKENLYSEDTEVYYDLANNETINYNASIPLYEYQEVAVHAMLQKGYGILQSPAGSGKTQMGIAMIIQSGKKALWLTHTKDLLQQSYHRAAMYIDKTLLGMIAGGNVQIGSGITFATVQTMANLDLSQYKYEWDMIIVDECHRACGTATSYSRFAKVLNHLAAQEKYGLSATVHRADGMIKGTFALLGGIGHSVPEEATAGKVERVRILKRDTGIRIHSSCQDTDGTLLYVNLIQYLINHAARNQMIAADLIQNAEHYNLILSDRIEHLKTILALLPYALQQQAVLITGSTKPKEREQAIEDMRSGCKRYLFATYALAKEGLDIQRLDRLYLTTPQKDSAVIIQAIGRIARHFNGKAEPVAYDYVDQIQFCQNQYKKRCTSYRKIKCIL